MTNREYTGDRQAESSHGPESAASTLGAISTGISVMNGIQQLTAYTQPVAQPTPGGTGIGLGVSWIKIPIPFPRVFTVQEAPSVTIPLTSANVAVPVIDPRLHANGSNRPSLTEAEIAQTIQDAVNAELNKKRAAETAAAEAAEKKKLQEELNAANERVLKLTEAVESIKKETTTTKKMTQDAVDSLRDSKKADNETKSSAGSQ